MKWSNSVLSAAALGLLALGLASTPAFAGSTNTGSLAVTATVNTLCTITPGTLAFGSYTGAVANNSSSISIACSTPSVSYTVGLNGGTTGTPTARVLTGTGGAPTSSTLAYKLCSDSSSCSTNWGDVGGTGLGGGTTSTSGVATLTVWGQIAGGLVVAQGTYSDTVIATISY